MNRFARRPALTQILGFTAVLAGLAAALTPQSHAYDGYDPYAPEYDNSALAQAMFQAYWKGSLALGDALFSSRPEALEAGCPNGNKPVGSVVTARWIDLGYGSLGLRENIGSVAVQGHLLRLITQSGEFIDYPLASNFWARIARNQLCTDTTAYVDLSDERNCKRARDVTFFHEHSCNGLSSRQVALSVVGSEFRAEREKHSAGMSEIEASTLAIRCDRELFPDQANADRILPQELDLKRFDDVSRGMLSLGSQKIRAMKKFFATGKGTPGFVEVREYSCPVPAIYQ